MTTAAQAPVPPQNLEAEESILGAMLLSKGAIESVLDVGLTWPDFYRASHGKIFQAACGLYDEGEAVDAITLTDRLEREGALEKVGGRGRIHELAAMVPAASNAKHYAKIVREQAGLRRLIRAGQEIQRLGNDRPGTLDELLAAAEAELTKATTPTSIGTFASITDGLEEVLDEIRVAYKTGVPKMGLVTGYTDLDAVTTGFHPGQLILFAARPSMGKSALMQNICENVADAGVPTAILSLEMSKGEIQIRSLSRASRIDSRLLRTGKLSQDQIPNFQNGIAKVKGRADSLFIDDNPNITAQKLRAEGRRLHRQHGIGLLAIDYLQLMLSESRDDNRQNEISNISRSLKLLARELEIPVIALSQLNRNLESRPDKRPMLSDLRDSGALEQDADVVLFVYRDEYYNPDSSDKGIAEIIVGKNRNGSSDTVRLGFVKRHTEFKSIAREGE